MYKRAVRDRVIRFIVGVAVVGPLDAYMIWLALIEPVAWIIVAFLTPMLAMIVVSFVQTRIGLKKMKNEYSGDIEFDVDNCDLYVADKYFFLNGYLVDPHGGHMISYDDITSVTTYNTISYESSLYIVREVKVFTRDSDKPIRFDNFNNFDSRSTGDISKSIGNLECFVELLRVHVRDDVKFKKENFKGFMNIFR